MTDLRNLDFKGGGGMMAKDVTKLVCLNVGVYVQGFIQGIEFWEGGLQSSGLTWRECIAHN